VATPDVRQVVTLLSSHCNWVTETRLMETNWDRFQRRSFNIADIAELYHENSKMRPYQVFEVGLSTDIFRQPAIIESCTRIGKQYPAAEKVPLPVKGLRIRKPFSEVVFSRRSHRRYKNTPMPLDHLASLLYHALGVTGRMDFREVHTGKLLTQFFRAAPSGGALYPVEIYVVALRVDGLSTGTYHYDVMGHRLELLHAGLLPAPDCRLNGLTDFFSLFPIHPDIVPVDQAAVVLVMSGVLDRTAAKYGPRGYRYVLQETGHVCQNAWLAATALGYGAVSLAGFFDDELNEWLGLDGRDEAALYVLVIGVSAERPLRPVGPEQLPIIRGNDGGVR